MKPKVVVADHGLSELPPGFGMRQSSGAFVQTHVPKVAEDGHSPRRSRGLRQISIIAAKEFGDRFRSGWVVACVLVWLGAIGLTSFFGLLQIGQIGVQGYERTVISLLNLVQYLVPLLGLLVGYDLVVSEKEEPTLRLVVAGGVNRARFLLGKLLGGSLALSVPLALGFAIAGTVIGVAAKDSGTGPFLRLALSGMAMGLLFLGLGLMLSTFSRTRVQALVLVLLTWCMAVFVFDLIALGVMVSTQSTSAAREIEFVCDATHVNAAADLHSAYDNVGGKPGRAASGTPALAWLALNPVDLFRAVNLPAQTGVRVPPMKLALGMILWLAIPFGASAWKLNRSDL
ncbi:MAG: ABC transporter permease [Verrucomicrobiota bacterium]